MVDIKYKEPKIPNTVAPTVELENVNGFIKRVTTAPTWTPRFFAEQIAIDTTNDKFYIYDFDNAAWKSATIS